MRSAQNWKDYELLDATGGERLERWGEVLLIRPDPQILWHMPRKSPFWEKAHAVYHRAATGGGSWEQKRPLPAKWNISYKQLKFEVSPTGFKHTGLFPEQAVNWDFYENLIRAAQRPVRVLNLFGYTGAASLACAAAGASVCHVDASKGMVQWGRENALRSGLSDKPIRWIVDDCGKFAAREARRQSVYEGIIMDPPSYGRGPGGEVWKLEECIDSLIGQCVKLLSQAPLFFAVNSYTSGVSPSVMQYILAARLIPHFGGCVQCDEIGLPVTATGLTVPCGSTAIWTAS